MDIPKKIHYFWVGNNISENDLRNIIAVKYANPGFKVNIWSDSGKSSLIINRLRDIKFKYGDDECECEFDVGEIPINLNYRNVDDAFRFLRQKINHSNVGQATTSNYLSSFTKPEREERNTRCRYEEPIDLVNYLQYIYRINLKGNYHNYASFSDIARLAILYMEGGIYLDADVKLKNEDIRNTKNRTKGKFTYLSINSTIGIGDCTGLDWNSEFSYDRFGNAIIAALPQSDDVLNILLTMAINMKRHHLSIQIDESPEANKICRITELKKSREINKKIDLALRLKEENKINLDRRCGIQNPVWRTGIDTSARRNDNSTRARRGRRITNTMKMTGPSFIDQYLNPEQSKEFPGKYQLKPKYEGNSIFKSVSDVADWSIIKNKKYSNEDPFS